MFSTLALCRYMRLRCSFLSILSNDVCEMLSSFYWIILEGVLSLLVGIVWLILHISGASILLVTSTRFHYNSKMKEIAQINNLLQIGENNVELTLVIHYDMQSSAFNVGEETIRQGNGTCVIICIKRTLQSTTC